MADDKPIIVIKKKGGHGGHHGGAWKVAYADFVTAMMAFFMVMWLVNSASEPVKESVASYFRRPGIFSDGSGNPLSMGAAGILPDAPPVKPDEKKNSAGLSRELLRKKSGNDDDGPKRATTHGDKSKGGQGDKEGFVDSSDMYRKTDPSILPELGTGSEQLEKIHEEMEAIAEEIKDQIASSPELQELIGIVDVKVEADGLNIEIMDTDKSSMFALGSARILPDAEAAFRKIGEILAKTPNSIDIVGHTDAKPFSSKNGGYSNWELSADRANAARRLLLSEGVSSERITSVVGRAEKDLHKPEAPLDASNRRITLKMRFKLPAPDKTAPPLAAAQVSDYEKRYYTKQQEAVHSLTPKEVLNPPKPGEIIKLPKESKNAPAPSSAGKDKIFKESPVFGPKDIFANF